MLIYCELIVVTIFVWEMVKAMFYEIKKEINRRRRNQQRQAETVAIAPVVLKPSEKNPHQEDEYWEDMCAQIEDVN